MKASLIDVIEPGSKVSIGDGKIKGECISVSIDPAVAGFRVQYRIAWWDGNSRKVEWLEDCEVRPWSEQQSSKLGIGFANRQFDGPQVPSIVGGTVCKGGHNEPNTSSYRPPAPGGSGSTSTH